MLPKPEKNKKKSSAEQLDLVESISTEDKIKKKRYFLLITLFATVGLSFIFWTFRFFQNFSFSSVRITLPQFNSISLKSNDDQKQLNDNLNHLFSPNPERWHLSIASSAPQFNWSYNSSSSISDQTPSSTLGIARGVLPEGTEIKEAIINNATFSQYSALISLPQGKFSIIIKNDDVDSEKFKNTIPLIVENLYWSLLKSL